MRWWFLLFFIIIFGSAQSSDDGQECRRSGRKRTSTGGREGAKVKFINNDSELITIDGIPADPAQSHPSQFGWDFGWRHSICCIVFASGSCSSIKSISPRALFDEIECVCGGMCVAERSMLLFSVGERAFGYCFIRRRAGEHFLRWN